MLALGTMVLCLDDVQDQTDGIAEAPADLHATGRRGKPRNTYMRKEKVSLGPDDANKPIAICVSRVSTQEQGRLGRESLDLQMAAVVAQARAAGYAVRYKVWVTFSGRKDDAPHLRYIDKLANQGCIDAAFFYNWDRFSRDCDIGSRNWHVWGENDVALWVGGESYDPNDPDRKFLARIMMAAAEHRAGKLVAAALMVRHYIKSRAEWKKAFVPLGYAIKATAGGWKVLEQVPAEVTKVQAALHHVADAQSSVAAWQADWIREIVLTFRARLKVKAVAVTDASVQKAQSWTPAAIDKAVQDFATYPVYRGLIPIGTPEMLIKPRRPEHGDATGFDLQIIDEEHAEMLAARWPRARNDGVLKKSVEAVLYMAETVGVIAALWALLHRGRIACDNCGERLRPAGFERYGDGSVIPRITCDGECGEKVLIPKHEHDAIFPRMSCWRCGAHEVREFDCQPTYGGYRTRCRRCKRFEVWTAEYPFSQEDPKLPEGPVQARLDKFAPRGSLGKTCPGALTRRRSRRRPRKKPPARKGDCILKHRNRRPPRPQSRRDRDLH